MFALTLEPLAYWIRTNVYIRGLQWNDDTTDKISLYADDILIYVASPRSSINSLFHVLTNFGKYSGYSINWNKSVLYMLHGPPPLLPRGFSITVAQDGFKYLGIFVTPNSTLFHDRNLLAPQRRLHSDVAHWRSLPLSLPGRAALFKMLALSRFLYALQNCPFPIPDSYIRAVEGDLRLLLWDGKVACIALHKLTMSWYDGGLALPNLRL